MKVYINVVACCIAVASVVTLLGTQFTLLRSRCMHLHEGTNSTPLQHFALDRNAQVLFNLWTK